MAGIEKGGFGHPFFVCGSRQAKVFSRFPGIFLGGVGR